VTILAGTGCAGVHAELIGVAPEVKRPDCSCAAWEGVYRVRQSVRCRYDRATRIFIRLLRNDGLRHLTHDRDRFRVSGVLSQACDGRIQYYLERGKGTSLERGVPKSPEGAFAKDATPHGASSSMYSQAEHRIPARAAQVREQKKLKISEMSIFESLRTR
jgi:hypothetical protein